MWFFPLFRFRSCLPSELERWISGPNLSTLQQCADIQTRADEHDNHTGDPGGVTASDLRNTPPPPPLLPKNTTCGVGRGIGTSTASSLPTHHALHQLPTGITGSTLLRPASQPTCRGRRQQLDFTASIIVAIIHPGRHATRGKEQAHPRLQGHEEVCNDSISACAGCCPEVRSAGWLAACAEMPTTTRAELGTFLTPGKMCRRDRRVSKHRSLGH